MNLVDWFVRAACAAFCVALAYYWLTLALWLAVAYLAIKWLVEWGDRCSAEEDASVYLDALRSERSNNAKLNGELAIAETRALAAERKLAAIFKTISDRQ